MPPKRLRRPAAAVGAGDPRRGAVRRRPALREERREGAAEYGFDLEKFQRGDEVRSTSMDQGNQSHFEWGNLLGGTHQGLRGDSECRDE